MESLKEKNMVYLSKAGSGKHPAVITGTTDEICFVKIPNFEFLCVF